MTAPSPDQTLEFSRMIPAASLSGARPIPIDETASEAERLALGKLTGAEIASLSVNGALTVEGAKSWRLVATLSAKLTQTCVVTLEPLPATLNEEIDRRFSDEGLDADVDLDFDPEGDDPADPIGDGIDIGAAAIEALALAIDPYPRKSGAAFETKSTAPPGVEPMGLEAPKPFAGLAALKKAMEDGE